MTASSDQFYHDAIRRIYHNILFLAAAGTAGLLPWGWRASAGFAFGAAISWFAFSAFHFLAGRLGRGPDKPAEQGRRFALAWMIGFRWVAVGLAAYVIIKVLGVAKGAFLAGLMVLGAAVLIEILFELILHHNA